MYIRRTTIKSRKDGGQYYTYRLVRSERIGKRVRQHTLLNLGTSFSLPREQWPELVSRIQSVIDGQIEIVKLLLEKGANVSVKDNYGYTAEHWAKYNGHLTIAEILRVTAKNLQLK